MNDHDTDQQHPDHEPERRLPEPMRLRLEGFDHLSEHKRRLLLRDETIRLLYGFGYSQSKIALALNISRPTVIRVLNGDDPLRAALNRTDKE